MERQVLIFILLFQTLISPVFGMTVSTSAPNTGISKVMAVENSKIYDLNFNSDVLSIGEVEVNIKELGLIIASQKISTSGNNTLTFSPNYNTITVEFNRTDLGTASLQFKIDNIQLKEVISAKSIHQAGEKSYELSDHLSNVRTTISDKKMTGSLKVISTNDYYPFGMETRSISNDDYRYGFNAQEKDNEVADNGNSYSAVFWQYDPRMARRWNVDPVLKEYESAYSCFANNPNWIADATGADTSFADNKSRDQFNKTYKKIEDKINKLENQKEQLGKMKEKGEINEDVYNNKLNAINADLSLVNRMIDDFDAVIKSDLMFHYTSRANPGGRKISGGGIKYDSANDRYNIKFYEGNGGTIVHETTHGNQIIQGYLVWGKGKRISKYDYSDELEAMTNGSNYYKIVEGLPSSNKRVKTEAQIRAKIIAYYSSKSYISKTFESQYVPGAAPKERFGEEPQRGSSTYSPKSTLLK